MLDRVQSAFDWLPKDLVNDAFWACVHIMQWMCGVTGISYEALNIWLFVIIQPALILLFAGLWIKSRYFRHTIGTVRNPVTIHSVYAK